MLKYTTRDGLSPGALPRIVLIYSPEDGSELPGRLTDRLLSAGECAVCACTELPDPADLENAQLIAFAVTEHLLAEDTAAAALKLAGELHIPVMPIVPERLSSSAEDALGQLFGDILPVILLPDEPCPELAAYIADRTLTASQRSLICRFIVKYGFEPRLRTPLSDHILGMAYLNGIMTAPDRKKALTLLRSSAEVGYVPAMEQLANMYDLGIAVPEDLDRAAALQKQVADSACAALGAGDSPERIMCAVQALDRYCGICSRTGARWDGVPAAERILAICRRSDLPRLDRFRLEALCDICTFWAGKGDDVKYLEYAPEYTALCGKIYESEHTGGFRYADALTALIDACQRVSSLGTADYSAEIRDSAHRLHRLLGEIAAEETARGETAFLRLAMRSEIFLSRLDPPELHTQYHEAAVKHWQELFAAGDRTPGDCWECGLILEDAADLFFDKLFDYGRSRELYLAAERIFAQAERDEEFTQLNFYLERARCLRRAGEGCFAQGEPFMGQQYFSEALFCCRTYIENAAGLISKSERSELDLCLWDVFDAAYDMCRRLAGYGGEAAEYGIKTAGSFDTLLCTMPERHGLVLGWRLIISFGQMFSGYTSEDAVVTTDEQRLREGISRLTRMADIIQERLRGAVCDEILTLYFFLFDAYMDASDPESAVSCAEASDEVYRAHKNELHDKGFDYHLALLQKTADVLVGESLTEEAERLLIYLTEECSAFIEHGVIAPDEVYYLDVVRTLARVWQTLGIVHTGDDRPEEAAEDHMESIRLSRSLMERPEHIPDDEFWFAAACFELAMADPDERQEELMSEARAIADRLAEEFPDNEEYAGLKNDFDSFFPAYY
ncbi:MAG: sel1 repeat family protein [Ruminococcus sp.]|nr:sel1 repeat family protein [Ruminococcus sp.]